VSIDPARRAQSPPRPTSLGKRIVASPTPPCISASRFLRALAGQIHVRLPRAYVQLQSCQIHLREAKNTAACPISISRSSGIEFVHLQIPGVVELVTSVRRPLAQYSTLRHRCERIFNLRCAPRAAKGKISVQQRFRAAAHRQISRGHLTDMRTIGIFLVN